MSGKIEQELDRYFLPREELSVNVKSDGYLYHTYLACTKAEYWPDGQPLYVIIKEIPKALGSVYNSFSEVCHPYLEKVYGVLEDEERCYAVNEYITPPSAMAQDIPPDSRSLTLETFIQQYHENPHSRMSDSGLSYTQRVRQSLSILLELCEALETVDKYHLIHGDIHPANILLTDISGTYRTLHHADIPFCVKLIDFDNTQVPKGSNHSVTHVMGTKQFSAPEILDFSHPLDRADIYSLGCILYYSVYGKSPKEQAPDRKAFGDRRADQIFRRCTASYEARYKRISALKKDIMRALRIPENPLFAIVYRIPGFRSGSPWKMTLALYMYFSFFLTAIYTLVSIIQSGFRIEDWQRDNLLITLWFFTEIAVVFDIFGLSERSRHYIHFKYAHPISCIFIKFFTGLIIFAGLLLFFMFLE